MIDGLHKKLSHLRMDKNSRATINNMPEDVSFLVFWDVLEEWRRSRGYYERLFALRSVCKAWRFVIDGHPLFWTPTFPELVLAIYDIAIPKSQGLPLEIRYPILSLIHEKDARRAETRATRFETFLSRALVLRVPIKSLVLGLRSWTLASAVTQLLALPAPHIESLELTHYGTGPDHLFSGVAPLLQHVALGGSALSSPDQRFAHVRRLQLLDLRGLSIQRLIRLIAQCPLLEELVIEHTELHTGPLSSSFDTDADCCPPPLRSVALLNVSIQDSLRILHGLPIRPLSDLTVLAVEPSTGLDNVLNFALTTFRMSKNIHMAL